MLMIVPFLTVLPALRLARPLALPSGLEGKPMEIT